MQAPRIFSTERILGLRGKLALEGSGELQLENWISSIQLML